MSGTCAVGLLAVANALAAAYWYFPPLAFLAWIAVGSVALGARTA